MVPVPPDTARSFLKRSKLGQYNEEKRAQQEAESLQRLAEEKAQASTIPMGSRCEVQVLGHPPRRGTVMFVGTCPQDLKPCPEHTVEDPAPVSPSPAGKRTQQ